MYIMALDPISIVYIIIPSHQFLCLCMHLLLLGNKLGKSITMMIIIM
jgi:hypothetical protein